MAASSKHPLDIYTWIKKCIDSCVTYRQLDSCYGLVCSFKTYLKATSNYGKYHDIYYELDMYLMHKRIN